MGEASAHRIWCGVVGLVSFALIGAVLLAGSLAAIAAMTPPIAPAGVMLAVAGMALAVLAAGTLAKIAAAGLGNIIVTAFVV